MVRSLGFESQVFGVLGAERLRVSSARRGASDEGFQRLKFSGYKVI